MIRNTSFRYAYFLFGYFVVGLLLLMIFGPEIKLFEPEGNDGSYIFIATLFTCAALPSMVMAWRERDI
jgi:ABC-type dipeptide/oligopeptide/nickel transport system permease component